MTLSLNGSLPGNQFADGPAFSVYQTVAQTILTTFTKLIWQVEEFDTANLFDLANSRFIPNVAGYYYLNAGVTPSGATTIPMGLYKNGIRYKILNNGGGTESSAMGGCLVYLNGITDYVEIYAAFGVSQTTSIDASNTYFQGHMVRSA